MIMDLSFLLMMVAAGAGAGVVEEEIGQVDSSSSVFLDF